MNQIQGRSSRPLLGIQAARGVAALFVVLSHAEHMLALPQYMGHVPLGGVFNFGNAGVDFFFVLSGFIIFFVHHADLGRPSSFARYARRRLTRIYPIYWVVTAVVIALALCSAERAGRLDPLPLVASLLLVPHGQPPLLGVAWTLQHEMLFYLFFAAVILSRRIGTALFGVWAAIVVIQILFAPDNPVIEFIGDAYHTQFFMGLFAAWLVLTDRVPAPLTLAIIGTLAFFAIGVGELTGFIPATNSVTRLFFGTAATLVVAGLAAAEQQGRLRVGRIAAFLGGASYALYLVHTIAIGLMARLLGMLDLFTGMPDWLAVGIATVSAVLAGCLVHIWVEQPLLRALRPASARRPALPAGGVPG